MRQPERREEGEGLDDRASASAAGADAQATLWLFLTDDSVGRRWLPSFYLAWKRETPLVPQIGSMAKRPTVDHFSLERGRRSPVAGTPTAYENLAQNPSTTTTAGILCVVCVAGVGFGDGPANAPLRPGLDASNVDMFWQFAEPRAFSPRSPSSAGWPCSTSPEVRPGRGDSLARAAN